jgi:peptidoglycan/xylan/chitin deacetylase (PgdA/CDA1 family)
VAITFDDGFQNNYDVAFPLLRDAGLPATIFLTTAFIGTDQTLWYCRLNRAVDESRMKSFWWRDREFVLTDAAAKQDSARRLNDALKKLPHRQLELEVRQIAASLGVDGNRPLESGSPFRMLKVDQIQEMSRSGLIEFGAHTCSHAILSRLSSEEQRAEIGESLAVVQRITGSPCAIFAYPNGLAEDYDQESLRILEASGVRTSVTAVGGMNDGSTSPLELKRIGIGMASDWNDFVSLLDDAWGAN